MGESRAEDISAPVVRRRVVAIVGRPNGGKSALFNRLAGRRLAIVHDQSGTTRDRLVVEVNRDGQRFDLIDTGGIVNLDEASIRSAIDSGVRRQVDLAIQDAAVCLFVVDAAHGMHALDTYVAGVLRARAGDVLVVANKCDAPSFDLQASEFERFGFPVFAVSALHDRGIDVLLGEILRRLPAAESSTRDTPLKVAIVGRPNVGKSSYVNRLLRDDRVIVSEIAGTTRDSIEVPFTVGSGPQARHYLLIDTAGLRRPGRTGTAVDGFSMMRAEAAIQHADVAVLVTDAMQGITAQDRRILGSIIEHGKGCVVLATKWDLSPITQRSYLEEWRGALSGMSYVPLVFASSLTGFNIRRTVEVIDHVASQVAADLPTGPLNRVIQTAVERHPPIYVRGKKLKILYATQTGHRPVRVCLFVNDSERLTPAYRQYLIAELRRRFGLEGAPVTIETRERTGGKPRHQQVGHRSEQVIDSPGDDRDS